MTSATVDTPIGGDEPKDKTITVVQVGAVRQLAFKAGMTIAQALAAAELRPDATAEIRLNNRMQRDRDTSLEAGDQLMVVGRIAGGA